LKKEGVMEEKRTNEELAGVLEALVAAEETRPAIAIVNGLSREQSNVLSVRLVAMLAAVPKRSDEARLAIRTLYADESFRIEAWLVLAQCTHERRDVFALKVMIEAVRGAFILDARVRMLAEALFAAHSVVQEPQPAVVEEDEVGSEDMVGEG
jgi:hypothetical protein